MAVPAGTAREILFLDASDNEIVIMSAGGPNHNYAMMEVFGTSSGTTFFASNSLRSSGTLVTESGANIDTGTFYVSAGSNRVGIGTTTPKATLEVLGTISGSNVFHGGSASGRPSLCCQHLRRCGPW